MDGDHGFVPVTESDHRAWLWVVSILSLTYSFLCMGARVTSKWEMISYDDAVLGVAYCFVVVHYGLVFKAIFVGLGASTRIIASSAITSAAEYYFASRLLTFIAQCFSKLSVLVFTRRIFSGHLYGEKIIFAIAYASTAIYGLAGVLLSSAGCRPGRSLDPSTDAVCDANITRWSVITALDVITEVMLVALPMWFISKNQIKASKKRVVIFVFSFRLGVAAISIAYMATYFAHLSGPDDISIGAAPLVAWQEVLLGVSLITASIPCLRTFLWAFMSTGLMTVYGNSESASKSGSMHMNTRMSRSKSQPRSQIRSQNRDDQQPLRSFPSSLRPDWLEYNVDIRSSTNAQAKKRVKQDGGGDGGEQHQRRMSDGSEQMIIHHTREIEIEHS